MLSQNESFYPIALCVRNCLKSHLEQAATWCAHSDDICLWFLLLVELISTILLVTRLLEDDVT